MLYNIINFYINLFCLIYEEKSILVSYILHKTRSRRKLVVTISVWEVFRLQRYLRKTSNSDGNAFRREY